MIQDREGFIWAGTQNGLNRFDGHRFITFNRDFDDTLSLSGDFVTTIYEKGDYLLVGTFGNGLNIFHKKSQRFYRVPQATAEQSPDSSKPFMESRFFPAKNVVANMVEDAHNDIWMKASNPHHDNQGWVVRMRVPQGFWEQLADKPELIYQLKFESWWMNRVELYPFGSNTLAAAGNEVYCFQLDELLLFDIAQRKWVQAPQPQALNRVVSNIVWWPDGRECLIQTPEWSTWHGFGTAVGSAVGKLPGQVFAIDEHLIWVREHSAIKAYPYERSPFRIYPATLEVNALLTDRRTLTLFDRSGNLWFTNETSGLIKYRPVTGRFEHHFKGHSIMSRPYLTEKGGLFFMDMPGLFRLKGRHDPVVQILAGMAEKGILSYNFVDDGKGLYWMAAYHTNEKDVVLVSINAGTGHTRFIPAPRIKGVPFHAVLDDQGKLWFATALGNLVCYNTEASGADDDPARFQIYDFSRLAKDTGPVYYLEKSPDGSWWMATNAGLIRAKPKSNNEGFDFMLIQGNAEHPNGLQSSIVSSLLADPKDANLLWIGTKGGGLSCMNIQTGEIKTLSTKEGLPDKVIYGILSDHNIQPPGKDYSLWLSANRGIIRYTPATGEIKNYRKSDGLQEDEFNTNAFNYSDPHRKAGLFLFGGVNGLNVFDPRDLKDNPVKPLVLITGIRVNDQTVCVGDSSGILSEAIEFTRKITLPFSKNSIYLEFSALEYTAPAKNRYRFWLSGFENEANAHLSEAPDATYIGLPPGKYTFIVYGANNDGVWSDQPARLEIEVLPPWYRTFWAYLTYLLLLAGMVYWVIRHYRLEKVAAEARHQLEIHQIKLEDFTRLLLEKSKRLEEIQQKQSGESRPIQPLEEAYHEPDELNRLYYGQILTKNDWENFQLMFEKANPGFLRKLEERLPKLTAAETRLILLTRMGMGKKEIASMLGISPESVKKTGQRLRKKLGQEGYTWDNLFGEP